MFGGISLLALALQTAPVAAPSSIIGAVLSHSRPIGVADCSPDPNAICENMLFEARIRVVDNLAGPRVRSGTTIRYISHLQLPRGRRIWLLVGPAHRAYRRAAPLSITRGADSRETCVYADGLRTFGAAPPGGTPRGDDLCYRDP